jgi:hypothetical protein
MKFWRAHGAGDIWETGGTGLGTCIHFLYDTSIVLLSTNIAFLRFLRTVSLGKSKDIDTGTVYSV